MSKASKWLTRYNRVQKLKNKVDTEADALRLTQPIENDSHNKEEIIACIDPDGGAIIHKTKFDPDELAKLIKWLDEIFVEENDDE